MQLSLKRFFVLDIRDTIQPALVVLFICLGFTTWRYATYQDWFAFIDYDGYFNYYIATSGLNAEEIIPLMGPQGASYRYQRIIYPISAYLLSLGGNKVAAPIFLVLLNIASIALGTYIFACILKTMGTSPWYALVYGLFGSQFLALMTGLAEPMTFLFVVLGIYLWQQQKISSSVAAFALAALTKETALLFVFAFVAHYFLSRNWRLMIAFSVAGVPYALWQIVLWIWLGSPGFASGYSFEFPLSGYLSGFFEKPFFAFALALVLIPMTYLPMALLGLKASFDFVLRHNWHPYVLMILIHVLFMLVLPRTTAREPAAMIRITQGLVLSAILYASLIGSRRILNYSVLWIATLVILVKGSG